jgi:hypothetical protein
MIFHGISLGLCPCRNYDIFYVVRQSIYHGGECVVEEACLSHAVEQRKGQGSISFKTQLVSARSHLWVSLPPNSVTGFWGTFKVQF